MENGKKKQKNEAANASNKKRKSTEKTHCKISHLTPNNNITTSRKIEQLPLA
jgi:hypothetical protein